MKTKRKVLENKTVAITGASSGIGRATALEFARLGANLVLIARGENNLKEVAAEAEKLGAKTLVAPADVVNENAVTAVAERAASVFGGIDIWVNNAAVNVFGRFDEVPFDAYKRVIETNLFGYLNGARAVIGHFHRQQAGTLVNVSSISGTIGLPYSSAYTASKFAINGFSESLRAELKGFPSIRVCTVLAASIDTPLFQHSANYTGKAVKPVGPLYRADKVARAIVRLATCPRDVVTVGGFGRRLMLLHSLFPSMTENIAAKKAEKEGFEDKLAPQNPGNLFKPADQWSGSSGGWLGAPVNHRRRNIFIGAGLAGLSFGIVRWFAGRNHHRAKGWFGWWR